MPSANHTSCVVLSVPMETKQDTTYFHFKLTPGSKINCPKNPAGK